MPAYLIAASCIGFVFLFITGYVSFARWVARRHVEIAFWDQVFPDRPDVYDWATDPGFVTLDEPVRYYDDLPRNTDR